MNSSFVKGKNKSDFILDVSLLLAQLGLNLPTMGETWFDPWVGKIPWRRERVPTPVFWPGEFQEQRSLVGCSPRGRKELVLR